MIANQVYVFLWTIITGVIMGLVFDAFRILRKNFKSGDFFVYVQDILFWLIIAILLIISAFLINDGELRGFMFLGYIFGVIFYMFAFSKFIIRGATILINLIKKILKLMIKPFIKILNPLTKLINNLWNNLAKKSQSLTQRMNLKKNFAKKTNN
jgi:spore cortex biosynthesis protein YabQ